MVLYQSRGIVEQTSFHVIADFSKESRRTDKPYIVCKRVSTTAKKLSSSSSIIEKMASLFGIYSTVPHYTTAMATFPSF